MVDTFRLCSSGDKIEYLWNAGSYFSNMVPPAIADEVSKCVNAQGALCKEAKITEGAPHDGLQGGGSTSRWQSR